MDQAQETPATQTQTEAKPETQLPCANFVAVIMMTCIAVMNF